VRWAEKAAELEFKTALGALPDGVTRRRISARIKGHKGHSYRNYCSVNSSYDDLLRNGYSSVTETEAGTGANETISKRKDYHNTHVAKYQELVLMVCIS